MEDNLKFSHKALDIFTMKMHILNDMDGLEPGQAKDIRGL